MKKQHIKKYIEYADLSAYEILDNIGIKKLPIDPFEIAEKLDIEVLTDWDMPRIKNEEEGRAFVESGEAKIWLNPVKSENRKKFTLSHEIAHVINDIAPKLKEKKEFNEYTDDSLSLSFARSGKSDIKEFFANEYGARLLMPSHLILAEANKIADEYENEDFIPKEPFVEKMAKIFAVSESAMTIRLIRLGIIKAE